MERPTGREKDAGLRLALAGGGTGGHLVPGLHLVEQLTPQDRESGVELRDLLWFHSGRAVEERVLGGLGGRVPTGVSVECVALPIEPAGGGAPSLRRLARKTPDATRVARRALAEHGVDVLLGLGGFTSVPAVIAARSLRIPCALLEINAVRGRATRFLGPLCARVFHAWPVSVPRGAGPRHVVVGPPLSPAIGPRSSAAEQRAAKIRFGCQGDAPLLVVFGGSQGAGGLNDFMRKHVAEVLGAGVEVVHQVGPGRLMEAEAGGPSSGYRAVEYVDDVPLALAAADLALCRGGASTLAEIAAAHLPAWVVPYPHHVDRHQEQNALQLGAGVRVVPEATLGPELARELVGVLTTAEGRRAREHMASELAGVVAVDAGRLIWAGLAGLRR